MKSQTKNTIKKHGATPAQNTNGLESANVTHAHAKSANDADKNMPAIIPYPAAVWRVMIRHHQVRRRQA
jgi:hypothetical protein